MVDAIAFNAAAVTGVSEVAEMCMDRQSLCPALVAGKMLVVHRTVKIPDVN